MGRTIVVGDIHGCFDELMDLIQLLELQAEDRVIAVGDLTCKGPKTVEVLELFLSDQRFSSVVGNHERLLRQRLRGEPVRLAKEQRTTLKELEFGRERYFQFLRSLPFTINLGSHLVVHAGVRPGVPLRRQMAADLTEIRTMGADPSRRRGVRWYDVYRGPKTVLFGHWPAKKPRRGRYAIGLDTACVYGGRLTAFVIEKNEFFSVPARKAYARKR
jgi:hypothetical protein